MQTELLILKSLLTNERYCRAVLPYIKEEYFSELHHKAIFKKIQQFIEIYNNQPTIEALTVVLEEVNNVNDEDIADALSTINSFENTTNTFEWLVDHTEKFCKERAIHNAIMDSIHIINHSPKNTKNLDKGAIPDLLKDALSISFDPSVGHDFLADWDPRFEFYHNKEERIPFDITQFNDLTKGGMPRKTLNVILAGVNVGKTLAMCHFAASHMMMGKNVLYITLEIAEERIAERIDANVLDVNIGTLEHLSKPQYKKLIEQAQQKYTGKMIIKEYPPTSASANHFRFLLNELKLKRKFIPDIIYIDYLNLCASARVKYSSGANSYTIVKSIAEELRALAVEFDVPIVSATQLTRTGYANSDPDLTDTSESFGLPATADFMFALVTTEELEKLGQLMVKQLKNRYNDATKNKTFYVGVDRNKMRLNEMSKSSAGSGVLDDDEDIDSLVDYKPRANRFDQFTY